MNYYIDITLVYLFTYTRPHDDIKMRTGEI